MRTIYCVAASLIACATPPETKAPAAQPPCPTCPAAETTARAPVPPPQMNNFRQPATSDFAARTHTSVHCGKERWSVKTGGDDLAGDIDLANAKVSTIHKLAALPWPNPNVSTSANLPDERYPAEKQVYELRSVALVCFKRETDADFHIVVRDGRETMVVEIPNADCVDAASPLYDQIKETRAAFEAFAAEHPGPCNSHTDLMKDTVATVTLRGVAFFDRIHGQTGVSEKNGIELHPVVGMCFAQGCSL